MQSPPCVLAGRTSCNSFCINQLTKTRQEETFLLAFAANPSDLRNKAFTGAKLLSGMKSRVFYKDILNHCYQRSADGGVLFYTTRDHLVYFTLYCVLARKYRIQVLALCQMPDHIHDAVVAKRLKDLVGFKRELNSRFAKMYNAESGIKGPVFEMPFGSAPKKGAKAARTNIIYIVNNPVERQLVSMAEKYRWNYLAYIPTSHPFSDPLVIRRASKPMRAAVRMVKAQYRSGLPLNYTLIRNLTGELTPPELQQFTDFVISTYNVIDYPAAVRFFDNYADMMKSIQANTGSEYDLNEVFVGKSDKPYAQMTQILLEECDFEDIHQILSLDNEEKWKLFDILRKHTFVMGAQIASYLHLPLGGSIRE